MELTCRPEVEIEPMGNCVGLINVQQRGVVIESKEILKLAPGRVSTQTFGKLRGDWLQVAHSLESKITFQQFKRLMQDDLKDDELRMLYGLYDINHDNKVFFFSKFLLIFLDFVARICLSSCSCNDRVSRRKDSFIIQRIRYKRKR